MTQTRSQDIRYRRVAPAEAEAIASALAALHEGAFRDGMALGTLELIGRDGLELSYREAVAAVDDRTAPCSSRRRTAQFSPWRSWRAAVL